jgi:hypothetical protein
VILEVLALDWLATSQTIESGSKPDADGLGEHEGQFTRVNPLTDQGTQRGIAELGLGRHGGALRVQRLFVESILRTEHELSV